MITNDTVLDRANELKAAGRPFALATVVRSDPPTSAKAGAKAIVHEDGTIEGWIGGGCAQPLVLKTVKQALADGQSRLIRITPDTATEPESGISAHRMACHSGGTLDIFIDPVTVRPTLLVIGTSPTGQVLVRLAAAMGFAVIVAAPGADAARFPEADRVLPDFASYELRPPAFVVVATQGRRDEGGLEAAMASGAEYVAFIASRRKADMLREYLKERGYDPERVDAIVSPAGIPMGAVTPEEIALSVLAGVSQARRAGQGAVRVWVPAVSQDETEAPAADSEAVDPVCGMTVETGEAPHRSAFAGRTYYFCCGRCKQRFETEPEKYLESQAS